MYPGCPSTTTDRGKRLQTRNSFPVQRQQIHEYIQTNSGAQHTRHPRRWELAQAERLCVPVMISILVVLRDSIFLGRSGHQIMIFQVESSYDLPGFTIFRLSKV